MKVVVFDIETSPHLVYSWDTWKQDIQPAQMVEPSKMLMWCAKVVGKKRFISGDNSVEDLAILHNLLSGADAIVSYNGKKFDSKIINREFLEAGLGPLPKTCHIDLYQVVRSNFKFPHNKLDSITRRIGLGGKLSTGGFGLWLGVMVQEKEAIRTMQKYNKQDVVLTERLYNTLKPWVTVLPYTPIGCQACGSNKLEKRGTVYGNGWERSKMQCRHPACGRWTFGAKTKTKPTRERK